MLIYSKVKYMALNKYYDAIEQGKDRVAAAEQVIAHAESSDEWEQMVSCFTVVDKLLLGHVPLSAYLIERTYSSIKMFQSVPEDILLKQIPVSMYLTNMSREYQRICNLMKKEYDLEI